MISTLKGFIDNSKMLLLMDNTHYLSKGEADALNDDRHAVVVLLKKRQNITFFFSFFSLAIHPKQIDFVMKL